MQIGSVSLPGVPSAQPQLASAPQSAPAAGRPVPRPRFAPRHRTVRPGLVLALLLAMIGGATLSYGFTTGVLVLPLERWLSYLPSWARGPGASLRESQRNLARVCSPSRPIQAARQAMSVEAGRVHGGDAVSTPLRPPSHAPVAARPAATGHDAEQSPWAAIHVSAVIGRPGNYLARINERFVRAGDVVAGFSVIAISPQGVTLAGSGEQRVIDIGGRH